MKETGRTDSDGSNNHVTRQTAVQPIWARPFLWVAVAVLVVCGFAVHKVSRLLIARPGEHSGRGAATPIQAISALSQVTFDPCAGFPGKRQLNILVMGIDDNWTDQNIVYTKKARTDTLFLLTLDLDKKKASMLSIPRDSYVPIAGTDYSDKINSAYASGGPERAEATFAHVTGVYPDYYVVLKIDATKRLVDALGGVDAIVEHQMDYDDNWGHLHVHLKPGLQHLDGDQALSFIRFRHGNHGPTPEDGDPRRIYRQHVLIRAMIDMAKTFGAAINSGTLIDTGMSCIDTDLSRTQLADLAHIFQGINQDNILTAQLDGADARGANGAWLVNLDPVQVKAYVDWLVRGDEAAVWAVTPVSVRGAPHSASKGQAVLKLRLGGFTEAEAGGANTDPNSPTVILDTGVEDPGAALQVAKLLGLSDASVLRRPVKPNKAGWTPPSQISVMIGGSVVASAGSPT
jgi:LCP family protein required for cell wall assembly